MDKIDGHDVDKSEWIKLEFLMDPDNPASKYSRQFAIFKDGCPEDWIKWVMAFREIENLMPMKELEDKTRMFRTLLKDQALLLKEYEYLFHGKLGEFNIKTVPICLQLMYCNCKPIHARAYTVPISVEQQLQQSKEIVRVVHIGVLEEDYSSAWASCIP
jgi:hypothetical protein